jgi:hypothetical protein
MSNYLMPGETFGTFRKEPLPRTRNLCKSITLEALMTFVGSIENGTDYIYLLGDEKAPVGFHAIKIGDQKVAFFGQLHLSWSGEYVHNKTKIRCNEFCFANRLLAWHGDAVAGTVTCTLDEFREALTRFKATTQPPDLDYDEWQQVKMDAKNLQLTHIMRYWMMNVHTINGVEISLHGVDHELAQQGWAFQKKYNKRKAEGEPAEDGGEDEAEVAQEDEAEFAQEDEAEFAQEDEAEVAQEDEAEVAQVDPFDVFGMMGGITDAV